MALKDTGSIRRLDALMNMSNVDTRLNLQDLELAVRNGSQVESSRGIDDELANLAREIGISVDDDAPHVEDDDRDEHDDHDHDRDRDDRSEHDYVEPDRRRTDNNEDDTSEFAVRTREQERREQVDTVIGKGPADDGFSFDYERREDEKYSKLAAIDSLLSNLEYDGVDTSRLPKVTKDSTFEEVSSVLRILQHKNDHARFCSIAEEVVLFITSSLEDLLDGKREIFGRKPDLTGWSSSVNVKLFRMRHDTGRIVSDVMQDYNISPFWRLLLELVPSAILYSQYKHRQFGQPGLNLDDASIARSANAAKTGLRKIM